MVSIIQRNPEPRCVIGHTHKKGPLSGPPHHPAAQYPPPGTSKINSTKIIRNTTAQRVKVPNTPPPHIRVTSFIHSVTIQNVWKRKQETDKNGFFTHPRSRYDVFLPLGEKIRDSERICPCL
jgi:hypothetical protein